MRVHAKAPCRVDLAGATLDIWPLYLFHENAVTVNFAIDRYTSCEIETRSDAKIKLRSLDLGREEVFDSLDELRAKHRHRLPLLAMLVRFFAPETGLEIESNSEAPAGAGISGSSALMIAVAAALNKLTERDYKLKKLREIAQNIEAQVIRVPTGSQDYYPALYGGASAIELGVEGIEHHTIEVDEDELNSRFVLAYTGAPRNSGINNWEVMKGHINGDAVIHRNFDRIARGANEMRRALEDSDWEGAARLMRDDWNHRRRNIPGISTPLIDQLITSARRAGATAAKACGAGGGGCVVFLIEPDSRPDVERVIEAAGVTVVPAKLATRGVQVR